MELLIFAAIIVVGVVLYFNNKEQAQELERKKAWEENTKVINEALAPKPVDLNGNGTSNEDLKNTLGILNEPKKCGCGRSETGYCVGLHLLTAEEWMAHEKNPNRVETPAKKKTRVKKSVEASAPAKVAKVKRQYNKKTK